jgi:prevent-host-death family protein
MPSITEARSQLGELVRRAAHGRETVELTDHGHVAAVLVSPHVIEDLEDDLAVAEYRRRKAEGDASGRMTQEQVRQLLGLER